MDPFVNWNEANFSAPFYRTELAKLPGDSKVFTAIDSDPGLAKFMDGHTPVEARIGLKVKKYRLGLILI